MLTPALGVMFIFTCLQCIYNDATAYLSKGVLLMWASRYSKVCPPSLLEYWEKIDGSWRKRMRLHKRKWWERKWQKEEYGGESSQVPLMEQVFAVLFPLITLMTSLKLFKIQCVSPYFLSSFPSFQSPSSFVSPTSSYLPSLQSASVPSVPSEEMLLPLCSCVFQHVSNSERGNGHDTQKS